jgi:hypothetical protein
MVIKQFVRTLKITPYVSVWWEGDLAFGLGAALLLHREHITKLELLIQISARHASLEKTRVLPGALLADGVDLELDH